MRLEEKILWCVVTDAFRTEKCREVRSPTELRTTELRMTELRMTELLTTELRATELRMTELITTQLKTTKFEQHNFGNDPTYNNLEYHETLKCPFFVIYISLKNSMKL